MDAYIYSLSAWRLHWLLAGPTTIYTEDGRELDQQRWEERHRQRLAAFNG